MFRVTFENFAVPSLGSQLIGPESWVLLEFLGVPDPESHFKGPGSLVPPRHFGVLSLTPRFPLVDDPGPESHFSGMPMKICKVSSNKSSAQIVNVKLISIKSKVVTTLIFQVFQGYIMKKFKISEYDSNRLKNGKSRAFYLKCFLVEIVNGLNYFPKKALS